MRYKLKEHVTVEMLIKCGLVDECNANVFSCGVVGFSTVIDFDTKELIDTYDDIMLEYLIELDYVEELK